MQFQADHLVQLPPELRSQFDILERRLWRVDTIIAVAGALSGLFVSYALLFISDRLWDTPAWMRLLFTGIGIGILAFFTVGWLRQWLWKRRDTRALANIVQSQYKRLGDRLLGIVELANAEQRPSNFSPALCRAAISQVSTEALGFDFRLAVATRKPKIYSLLAVFLLMLILAPCLLVPDASANALMRWIWPVSSTARYTFVTLEDVPAKLVVAHGEPFSIQCGVNIKTLLKNVEASFQYDRQPPINAPIVKNKVLFQVPPQTQPGKLRLRVGDVYKVVQVEPTHRPALKQLYAQIQMPEYLHYPDVEKEIRNGRLSVVEGSTVKITGKTTRMLARAFMGANEIQTLTTRGSDFVTGPIPLVGDMKLSFVWRDNLGLSNRIPTLLALSGQKDNAPQVEFPELGRAIAVLEDEVIIIRIASADDYGVKNVGVKLDIALPQKADDVKSSASEVKTGGYQEKRLEAKYDFSPALLKAPPGSLIGLKATSLDYLPGREPAESVQHRIFVMSKEDHAKLLMEEFEKLRAAIEELTRRQENLLSDTKLVKDLKPEDMAKDETTKQLGEQASEQSDFSKQLERLAQEALKTTKEAMRNKSIPNDTIKDWVENSEIMQDIARKDMSPAAQSLNSAQQSQNAQQRSEQVDKGSQQEQQALENLQELQKKMAAALDKMQAKSLADRLRAVGQTEKTVAEELQKSLPKTIGLAYGQIPPEIRKDLNRMTGDQEKTSKQTRKLQDEIQRFAQRTSSEPHGEVHKDMEEVKAVDKLAQVGELIKKTSAPRPWPRARTSPLNSSSGPRSWMVKDDGGGGGGGGGQQMSEEDLEKMLALLRIRETEENLREHTRLVEKYRKTAETYKDDASKLAGKQGDLSKELGKLKEDRLFAKAKEMMDSANEAMDDAESNLKRPRTDDPTFDAQTDAMNLLDEAIKSLMPQQGQGEGQSQQGMMAFMQMLAMGQGKPQMGENPNGQSPGGNNNGGLSERPNSPYNGDMRGRTGPNRTTQRVAGTDTRKLPAEYRDALQSYFNAIDQAP